MIYVPPGVDWALCTVSLRINRKNLISMQSSSLLRFIVPTTPHLRYGTKWVHVQTHDPFVLWFSPSHSFVECFNDRENGLKALNSVCGKMFTNFSSFLLTGGWGTTVLLQTHIVQSTPLSHKQEQTILTLRSEDQSYTACPPLPTDPGIHITHCPTLFTRSWQEIYLRTNWCRNERRREREMFDLILVECHTPDTTERVSLVSEDYSTRFCRWCERCMHCAAVCIMYSSLTFSAWTTETTEYWCLDMCATYN